jgi:hypothetical protein
MGGCVNAILVAIGKVSVGPWHTRVDDPAVRAKVASSLRRYGQLQPVIVRQAGETLVAISRQLVLEVMRELGHSTVWVWDLGVLDDVDAIEVALALETRCDTDYVRLAKVVSALPEDVLRRLPDVTPYTWERLTYLRQLLDFDWGQFTTSNGQGSLGWDAAGDEAPAELPMPLPAPAPAQAAPACDPAPSRATVPDPPAPAPPPPHVPDPEPALFGQMGLF